MIGRSFGRLTVLSEDGSDRYGKKYRCQCECGNYKTARGAKLREGRLKSCGCLRAGGKIIVKTHGMTKTPTFKTWLCMRERCYYPKTPGYKYCGAKGVTVCDRWKDSFESFLEDMGERPLGKTLDRIDPNGNYEPGNCRWATASEQNFNKRASRRAKE